MKALAITLCAFALASCAGYDVTGEVIFRDPETGAKAGMSRGSDGRGSIFGRYFDERGNGGEIILSEK